MLSISNKLLFYREFIPNVYILSFSFIPHNRFNLDVILVLVSGPSFLTLDSEHGSLCLAKFSEMERPSRRRSLLHRHGIISRNPLDPLLGCIQAHHLVGLVIELLSIFKPSFSLISPDPFWETPHETAWSLSRGRTQMTRCGLSCIRVLHIIEIIRGPHLYGNNFRELQNFDVSVCMLVSNFGLQNSHDRFHKLHPVLWLQRHDQQESWTLYSPLLRPLPSGCASTYTQRADVSSCNFFP